MLIWLINYALNRLNMQIHKVDCLIRVALRALSSIPAYRQCRDDAVQKVIARAANPNTQVGFFTRLPLPVFCQGGVVVY